MSDTLAPPRPRETRMETAGCTVRVLTGGAGPPLVYLHGAAGLPLGEAAWLPALARLAERHTVIVPEHPGYGATEDPPWLDGVSDLAFYYLSWLDRLGHDRVHLVGMSLGGWIAAEIAVRSTRRIATLTLCGPAGIHVKGVKKGDIFMWSPEELAANSFHDPALAAKFLALPTTPEGERVKLRNWRTAALLAWHPRLYNPHLAKWLHRIDVPTHILWAADDKILPLPYAEAWWALVPGAVVSVIPECGHLMHAEKPDRFAALVADFIARKGAPVPQVAKR
jgi:pimeloyl-ACP methyl ester carboxylesterase